MAVQVRQLNQLIKEQSRAIQPQLDLIDKDVATLEASGAAKEAGLRATQQQEFGNIEQRAQDKGMFFSGFSPDEQAKYTATTFLPALAELQATIARGRSELFGKRADLNTRVFDRATDLREGDIGRRFTQDERVAGQQFSAAEAARQRQFQAEQAQADRTFQASQNAANRAAQRAASRAPAQNIDSNIRAMLNAAKGDDGKVSPTDWEQIVGYAHQNGIAFNGDNGFASRYWAYANGDHWQDYLNGYEKYTK